MNREIRTDLAIELRENVADRRNMPGVKVKTVVNEDRSIKTTTITVLDEIGEKEQASQFRADGNKLRKIFRKNSLTRKQDSFMTASWELGSW